MSTPPKKRARLLVECDPPHKTAFYMRAALEDVSPQELIQRLVAQYCPEELRRAREFLARRQDEPPGPRRRKK